MKLTQAAVAGLKLPPGKSEDFAWDDALKGFGVRLRAGGKRTWVVQFRLLGQQRRLSLGSVDSMSAARARSTAANHLAKVALGVDPQTDRREERARSSPTLDALAPRFLEFKRRRLKPGSIAALETHLTEHWRPLARRPVHEIARRDVAARLGEIAVERGPVSANRARATLGAFFSWAMREGLAEVNPVVNTHRQIDETPRDHILSDAELVAVWRGCQDDDFGRIVRLLILTAQRRNEVGSIAKSEIAVGERKWTIPAERTKNSRATEVPLSDPALRILEPAIVREDRWGRDRIFGYGHFIGWSTAKPALDERIERMTGAKPAPWRLHDLRRTATTRMAELGVQPHILEAVLNHVSGHKARVAGVHSKATYWPEKRQALDLWAAHIEALLAGEAGSNAVTMKSSA